MDPEIVLKYSKKLFHYLRGLTWDNIQKNISGKNVHEKHIKMEHICVDDKYTSVTLPFKLRFQTALEACKLLGNGEIFTFKQPGNLTGFDFEYTFGKNFEELEEIWTPFSDAEKEGTYRNIHDGKIEEKLFWREDQPNGGLSENNVIISAYGLKLYDRNAFIPSGVTCSVDKKVITLRGTCDDSYFGNKMNFDFKIA